MLGRQVATALHNAHNVKPLTFSIRVRLGSRVAPIAYRRFYATPGRPKKAVGETSRPIKRTPRKPSSTTTSSSDAKAAKALKAAEAKKLKAEKAKSAKKLKAEKAKAKAAKLKAKTKKVLTPEQEAVRAQRAAQMKTQDLKKAALDPPNLSSPSAFTILMSEHTRSQISGASSTEDTRSRFSTAVKQASQNYKALTPKELEHYNHLAHTAKEAILAEYKTWVNKHTPEEIVIANKARLTLRRTLKAQGKSTTKWRSIQDERSVKRPLSGYMQFVANRSTSGDFKNIANRDRLKLIAQEWKALAEGEKKKYQSLTSQESKRYVNEYNNVYGHAPPVEQQHVAAAA